MAIPATSQMQPAQQTSALAKTEERHLATQQDTNSRAREIASRLKFMIVNGKNLSDNEVYALAQYSAANDLNPFAGEAYYLPGSGPCPGIAGWRKKAQEQLDWEAARQNTQAHFWTEDRPATHDEAKFDEKAGDIAIVVTLHDFLTNKSWRREFFATWRELRDLGMTDKEAKEEAGRMVGPEPIWTGIGIVFGSEKFSGDGKVEKYAREERAKKRAEKIALRKRFPRIHLPEPIGVIDAEDAIDVSFKSEPQQQAYTPEPSDPDQLMSDLGYDVPPKAKGTYTREMAEAEADAIPAEFMSPPTPGLPPLRYQPEQLKARIAETAKTMTGQISNGKRGLVVSILETILSQNTDPAGARHQLMKYLTGYQSTKDIPDAVILALFKWLSPTQDSGGMWIADPMAAREAVAAFNAAQPPQDGLF